MKTTLLTGSALALTLLALMGGPALGAPPELIGIAGMDYMETLPYFRDLVICREVSTHDKMGGNDNGFTNKAEFVRKEPGKRIVLLEAAGPGAIMSFWYSWLNDPGAVSESAERTIAQKLGNLEYYINGQPSPALSVPLREMIGPSRWGYPLAVSAEESTGGYISYVPMPFSDGVKVTLDGGRRLSFFYHFWYQAYPLGTEIKTWTGKEDLTEIRQKWDPRSAWKPAGAKVHQTNNLFLPAGAYREFFQADHAGVINCLRMKLPENNQALKSLFLQAWWDDEEAPAINAPLSLLYAVENRWSDEPNDLRQKADLRGTVIGQDPEGLFYFRLPMPFSRRARLALSNQGNQTQTIEQIRVEADDRLLPGLGKSAGYLRTQFRESDHLAPGKEYLLAELSGRGHIVGTVMAASEIAVSFLEGDEHIYIDGSRSPSIIGDATETYFNGSWYFLSKAFSCPFHGAPTFNIRGQGAGQKVQVTMYRFHLTDLIPFRSQARFSIQHGGFNEVQGRYRSLVFYYGADEPVLFPTDDLKISDPQSRSAHNFSGGSELSLQDRDGFFEGENNGQDLGYKKRPEWIGPRAWMVILTITGILHEPPKNSPDRVKFTVARQQEPCEFTVKVDPQADAIMLRRVLDQSVFDQRARIEVNGKLAGIWLNTGNNKWKIWAEDDLILDPALTRGKGELKIKVVPESESFSAAEYSVFSVRIPE